VAREEAKETHLLSRLEPEEGASKMHTEHQPADVADSPGTVREDAESNEETGGGEDGETLSGGRQGVSGRNDGRRK
jgi:hypothetical protein